MSLAKPNKEQFRLDGDKVIHLPTGAYWVAYRNQPEPHYHNPKRLGDVLDNGEDFDPHEVTAMALDVLRQRL